MTKKKSKGIEDGETRAEVVIEPPTTKQIRISIRGIAPYVQNKMTTEAIARMKEDMDDPDGKAERDRVRRSLRRDFKQEAESGTHVSTEGWFGIPSDGIKQAIIRAIDQIPNFPMTKGKAAIFIVPSGYSVDGVALCKITKGKPHVSVLPVSQAQKMNLRSRPMWEPGWEAMVIVEFDDKVMSANSLINLLQRAGAKVGIGSGRPFSKQSTGCGWGRFEVVTG